MSDFDIGDAIGDAIDDAVEELTADEAAAAEAEAAAAEAEAAEAEATAAGAQTDVNGDPHPPTTNVPVGTTREVKDSEGRTVIYTCKFVNGKKVWVEGAGAGVGGDPGWDSDDDLPIGTIISGVLGETDEEGNPLPPEPPADPPEDPPEDPPKEEEGKGGLLALLALIPQWLKDLLKIYLGGKTFKEGLEVLKYKVPTGQGAAISDYEKAHPLDIDMGLESLGPNYLQDQLYGIPIGAENVPAATHTLGFPYAEEIPVGIEEEVQVGQRGGIMNARSHGDIVPALLEPGEFVMNLQSVKGAGNGDARQGAKRMYKMMRQLERMGQ